MKPHCLNLVWNKFYVVGVAFLIASHLNAFALAQTRRGFFTSSLTSESETSVRNSENLISEAPSPEQQFQGNGGAQLTNVDALETKLVTAPKKHLPNERILGQSVGRSKDKKAKKPAYTQQRDQAKFLDFLATGAIQVGPASNSSTLESEKKDREDSSQVSAAASPNEPSNVNLNAIAKQYCGAISQMASDARIAWQEKHIHELEDALNKRADELNTRIDEFQALIAKHDDALQKADDNVVAIYAKMKPESAALQLAAMDEGAAAAILTKLNARGAGAILNEMPPDKAAHLASIMSLRKAPVKEEKKAS